MTHDLDLIFRTGSSAILLLLGVLFLARPRQALAARIAGILALNVIAYAAIALTPSVAGLPLKAPLIALSSGCSVVLLVFTRALFEDDFRPGWGHAAAWAVICGLGLTACLGRPAPYARIIEGGLDLTCLVIIAIAAIRMIGSWPADLVESRRRARVFIVVAALLHGAVSGGARVWLWVAAAPSTPLLSALTSASLFVIVLACSALLLRARDDDLFGEAPSQRPARAKTPDPDAGLLARLDRLMHEERLYRREDLTIGRLAHLLDAPEHRLRRSINGHLGQRNFTAFINGFRLAEAKAALADPSQAEVPITTIALDAGFGSLGPFNRAFRSETGMTPRDFRRSQLADFENRPAEARSAA